VPHEVVRVVLERILASQPGGSGIRLQRKQVLAYVNGSAVTAADLFPWRAAAGEEWRDVPPPTLVFLLERAIQRELVRQAARAQGVALSSEEERQLDELSKARGMRDEEEVEFDVRDRRGEFLLAALAIKAGVPSPFASEKDVESYYYDHAEAFGHLPAYSQARAAAWARIEASIRQTLATERQNTYRDRVDELIRQLKAAAQISGA